MASSKGSGYRVRVGEREHEVEVIDAEEGRTILVDGEPFEVDAAGSHVSRVSPGEAGSGRQLEVTLAGHPRPSEGWIAGTRAKLEVRSEAEARLAEALGKGAAGTGSGSLTAPMPGRVVKILVTAGEAVELGDPVIIVEAMKMENELQAPASGEVRSIAVAEGDTVDAGQVLVEITADDAE